MCSESHHFGHWYRKWQVKGGQVGEDYFSDKKWSKKDSQRRWQMRPKEKRRQSSGDMVGRTFQEEEAMWADESGRILQLGSALGIEGRADASQMDLSSNSGSAI